MLQDGICDNADILNSAPSKKVKIFFFWLSIHELFYHVSILLINNLKFIFIILKILFLINLYFKHFVFIIDLFNCIRWTN